MYNYDSKSNEKKPGPTVLETRLYTAVLLRRGNINFTGIFHARWSICTNRTEINKRKKKKKTDDNSALESTGHIPKYMARARRAFFVGLNSFRFRRSPNLTPQLLSIAYFTNPSINCIVLHFSFIKPFANVSARCYL